MTSAFDPRIIQVGVTYNGGTTTFQDLNIQASGRKYSTAIMNECEVLISNLTNQQKHDILTLTSPNQQRELIPVRLTLDVGRQSYGTFRLFEGDVIASGSTQPPDIGILLKSLTNSYFLAQVAGYTQAPMTLLSQISQQVADDNGVTLDFQATDKQINNFNFSGAPAKLVNKLNEMGGVNAFIDNTTLVVVNVGTPRRGATRIISSDTGMVGVPEVTFQGVRVKMMIDNSIKLYGQVQVISEINPAANGNYIVGRIDFEVATREQPFWYILTCLNPAFFLGGSQ